jgi:hypothetical protein
MTVLFTSISSFLLRKAITMKCHRWMVSCPKLHSKSVATKYQTDRQVGRCQRITAWHVSSPVLDAALVAEVHRNPFISATKHMAAANIPGQKCMVIWRLQEAGLWA